MTSEELFEEFIRKRSLGMACSVNELRRLEGEVWESVVVPRLAIPRSVKDDRPKLGKIILFRRGKFGALVGTFDLDVCEFDYEGQQHVWEYWMPIPELPHELPPIDKDEVAFEEWKCQPGIQRGMTEGQLETVKIGWMAARGKS